MVRHFPLIIALLLLGDFFSPTTTAQITFVVAITIVVAIVGYIELRESEQGNTDE